MTEHRFRCASCGHRATSTEERPRCPTCLINMGEQKGKHVLLYREDLETITQDFIGHEDFE